MPSIKQIVDQYLKVFANEKQSLQPLLDLIVKSSEIDLISRKNFNGHITASGFVVDVTRRRVLRLQHKKLGYLLQPGGHIKAEDESPLAAAVREIEEETKIKSLDHIAYHPDYAVPIDIDTHTIPSHGDEAKHLHHDFRYLFICRNPNELVLNTSEFELCEWGDIGKLMGMATFKRLKPKVIVYRPSRAIFDKRW